MAINSLYIHIPFCLTKCGYCAFYSVPGPESTLIDEYIQRLTKDFEDAAPYCGSLRSIYMGGGTPSLLSPAQSGTLLSLITDFFCLSDDCEFTVECNPESVSTEKLEVWRAAGINRLSMGVQSFDRKMRQQLGREVADATIRRALMLISEAGFPRLSLDLIYGIPGQSVESWRREVETACGSGVNHLSMYNLTIEEQSLLSAAGVAPVGDNIAVEMWDAAAETAAEYALERYEVSNFARPGAECRHNLDIWHGAEYIGCGPAAASFADGQRWTQPANLEAWLARATPAVDEISAEARATEIMAFGLRTVKGWARAEFQAKTGYDMMSLRGEEIRTLCSQGLLEIHNGQVTPTRQGLLFADHVAMELLL
ncbi:MAG: radical SAM family heme chaperone HemW [Lentisphaeria bacterium]